MGCKITAKAKTLQTYAFRYMDFFLQIGNFVFSKIKEREEI